MSKEHMNYLRRKTADEAEIWAADRIEELERDLERERIRLAACGLVALANTPDNAARAREMPPEYRSASLDDVIRAVDSNMALRQERDALQAEIAELVVALKSAREMIGHPDNIAIIDAAFSKVRKPT